MRRLYSIKSPPSDVMDVVIDFMLDARLRDMPKMVDDVRLLECDPVLGGVVGIAEHRFWKELKKPLSGQYT